MHSSVVDIPALEYDLPFHRTQGSLQDKEEKRVLDCFPKGDGCTGVSKEAVTDAVRGRKKVRNLGEQERKANTGIPDSPNIAYRNEHDKMRGFSRGNKNNDKTRREYK